MYTRKILTIMGAIPEDAPYLTLDDANRLIAEMKAEGLLDDIAENLNSIRARFNTIATAPDVDGGRIYEEMKKRGVLIRGCGAHSVCGDPQRRGDPLL